MSHLTTLMAALLCSGCFTFNDGRVPKIEIERMQKPPSMTITMTEHTLDGGDNLFDERTVGTLIANALGARWYSDGVIGSYGDPGEVTDPDYALEITGVSRHSGSNWAAFLTGLSLYLIPSSSNNEIALEAKLTDRRTGQAFAAKGTNSSTMWQHIIFVPVTPFGLWGGVAHQRDLYRFIYSEFERQGAFSPPSDR